MLGTCLTLSLTSCSDDDDDKNEEQNTEQNSKQDSTQTKIFEKATLTENQIQEMTVGYNQFAWNYLTKVAESSTEKDKNFFVSPLSMGIDWAMLENGANGETLSQIKNAIGFEGYSNEEVNGYFYSLIKSLGSAKDVEFDLANSMFYNTTRKIVFDSTFSSFLTNTYDAYIKGGDFSDAFKDEINQWCSDKTKGTIDKVIDRLDQENGLFELLNAVYLKGEWTETFDPHEMSESYFTTNANAIVLVFYVNDHRKLPYFEDYNLQYTEISLAKGDYSVFFALPKEGKGILETAEYLNKNWSLIVSSDSFMVNIAIPRFKVGYKLSDDNMKSILSSLGIKDAMDENKADLTSCFDMKQTILFGNPCVGNVIQKTFFELTEEGVEASAVTVIEVMDNSIYIPDLNDMSLTRPFIYGIRDTKTGVILFNGCLNDPSAE